MEPEVRAAFGPKHPGAVEYFEGIRDKFCNQVWTPTDFYVYIRDIVIELRFG